MVSGKPARFNNLKRMMRILGTQELIQVIRA
jgi:hypothetical protein